MDTHISGHWVRHFGDRNDKKKKNKLDIVLEEPTVWWAAC